MVVMDRIDHVTIVVKDMEESKEFYCKGFGLKVIRSWEREEMRLRSRLFGGNKGTLLELWEYDKLVPAEQNKNAQRAGINYIAFQVEDVESKIKELEKLGAKIIQNVQKGITVEKFALAWKLRFQRSQKPQVSVPVEDINGITIELVEMKK